MGVITKIHVDGDDATINMIQDCEPTLRFCASMRSLGATGSPEMKHAARVDKVVIEAYCKRHGITFHEFMANDEHIGRLLNDPDFSAYRIWQGKV